MPMFSPHASIFLANDKFPVTVEGSLNHKASKLALLTNLRAFLSSALTMLGSLSVMLQKMTHVALKRGHQIVTVSPNSESKLITAYDLFEPVFVLPSFYWKRQKFAQKIPAPFRATFPHRAQFPTKSFHEARSSDVTPRRRL
jgi:hypothetical protein